MLVRPDLAVAKTEILFTPPPQFAPKFIAPTPILIVAAYPGSGFRKGFYLHVEGTFGT